MKNGYFWCEVNNGRSVLTGHSYMASCAGKWIRRGSELLKLVVKVHLKNRNLEIPIDQQH